MAKDVLVTESLTDSMIEAGAKLIERLDATNSEVKSAFWLYSSEEQTWKLVIASPLVDEEGPRDYYKRIVDANMLANTEEQIVSIFDIRVASPKNHITQLFANVFGETASVWGCRFSRNTINGVFIEDAYLYRVNS
ncbi:MAG: hypothetical protein ACLFV4_13570 [Candidatus Hydrogenedentota bacterium]